METPFRCSTNAFRRELAHRSCEGLDVTLLWCPASGQNDESVVVCVCDSRDGAYFEIAAEPHLALAVYNHPFAYRDVSTVYYKDRRLAA